MGIMHTVNSLSRKVKFHTTLRGAVDRYKDAIKELDACRNAGEDDRAAMQEWHNARCALDKFRSAESDD
jgi:hypothetical protein